MLRTRLSSKTVSPLHFMIFILRIMNHPRLITTNCMQMNAFNAGQCLLTACANVFRILIA